MKPIDDIPHEEAKENSAYRLFVIFFLVLNLARIFSSIMPDVFLFGLDFYRTLPLHVSIIFIVLCFAFLSQSLNRRVVKILNRASRILFREPGGLNHKAVIPLITAFGLAFYFLRVKPYLGDGVSILEDLLSKNFVTLKDYFVHRQYETVSFFLFYNTASILAKLNLEKYQAFYMYNVISGILFLYYSLLLQRELFQNSDKRIISFLFLAFQAYLILFMGYIEYYAIPFALAIIYAYYSVRYIRAKAPLWYPGLALVVMLAFHLLGVILLPSFIYLYFMRYPPESFVRKFIFYRYPKLWLIAAGSGVVTALFARPGPLDHLLIKPGELLSFYNYAPYILFHASEIINLLILVSGTALFIIFRFRKSFIMGIRSDPVLNFFAIGAFSGLMLILFFRPFGNLAIDWDIMTIPLLMINLTGIVLLLNFGNANPKPPTPGLIISQSILFFVLWFTVNSMDGSAAQRIITLRNHGTPEKNPRNAVYTDGMTFKYYHLVEKDYARCREIGEIVMNSLNDESLSLYANWLKAAGMNDIAERLNRKYMDYMQNKSEKGLMAWKDYYDLGISAYFGMRNYEKAVWAFSEAIKLNGANHELHFWLGQTYEMMNQFETALVEYMKYDSLYYINKSHRMFSREDGLGKLYALFGITGRLEEGILYFKERIHREHYNMYFLGLLYADTEDFAHSGEIFDDLLAGELPLSDTMYYNIAHVFFTMRRYETCWNMIKDKTDSEKISWAELKNDIRNTSWFKSQK